VLKVDFVGNDIKALDKLKTEISDAFAEGKISDQHYNILNNMISDYQTRKDKSSSY
jgi:hypothetical protein